MIYRINPQTGAVQIVRSSLKEIGTRRCVGRCSVDACGRGQKLSQQASRVFRLPTQLCRVTTFRIERRRIRWGGGGREGGELRTLISMDSMTAKTPAVFGRTRGLLQPGRWDASLVRRLGPSGSPTISIR